MKAKASAVFFLVLTLGFMAYLDSPYSFLNRNYTYSASKPVSAAAVSQIPSTAVPEMVEKLEKRTKGNGYIVETYREYEVYKNSNGEVTKSVPTSTTDTLKYWDYSKNNR
ncbi:hypothetical protein ACF5W4_10090 [Bacillota bacterium Lsc_1132]